MMVIVPGVASGDRAWKLGIRIVTTFIACLKMIRRSSVFSTMTEVTHQVDHVLAVLAMM